MSTIEKVIGSRVRMLFKSIFFGQLIVSQNLVGAPDLNPPTMAVDGKSLFFHPEFVTSISKLEMEGVLVHEVLHLVLLHHLRRGNRDKKVWGEAADYVINLIVEKEGYHLPGTPLLDQKFDGWTTEKVYDYLMEHPEEQQPDSGESSCGEVMDAGTGGEEGKGDGQPMTAEEIAAETHKMKAQIQSAAQAARKRGSLPGSLESLINDICAPRADWRTILQRFVSEKAFSDFNFSQCNTRILHQTGIVTPIIDGEALGNLALIMDVSGSTSGDNQREQMAGEISDVLENFQCEVDVVYADTRVTNIETFTQDDLPLELHCGKANGGTVMAPAFQWVADTHKDYAGIILFTDGDLFDWDQIEEPSCPTLMACTRPNPSGFPDWLSVVDISQ